MHCHLCYSIRVEPFSQEKRENQHYTIIRCQECAVIQTWEHHAPVSPDYLYLENEKIDADRLWCQSQHKSPAFSQWERILATNGANAPGPLLDVGCGTGGFLRHVAMRGWEPFGFDSSQAQVEHAQKYLPNVRQATSSTEYLAKLSNTAPLFQVITLWDVLEHIRQPASFMADLRPILHPDGLLFIAVPSGGALPWKKWLWKKLGRPFSVDPWEHVFYYTPDALEHYLQAWGFQVLQMGSVVCYPRPWSLFEMVRRAGFSLLERMPALAPQIFVLACKSKADKVSQSRATDPS